MKAVEAVPQTKTDWDLLQSYHRDRRHEDFAELVQRYQDSAYRAAFARSGQAAQAEEAVQEAFLLLSRPDMHPDTRHGLDFRLWFLGVVSNVARHLARSERRQALRARNPAYLDRVKSMDRTMSEPEDGPSGSESHAALLDALGELKEEHRLPLVLHFLEGLTQAEVGQVIGLSQSRVARRIGEALKLVRLRLARTGVMLSATSLPMLLKNSSLLKAPPTLQAALAHPSLLECAASNESLRQAAVLPVRAAQAGKYVFAVCSMIVLAGSVVWFVNRAMASSAANVPYPVPAVQAPAPFHRVWSFEKGPSDELKVTQGEWNWIEKPERYTPCMSTMRDVGAIVRIPGAPFHYPMRIRLEVWLPVEGEWAASAVFLDKNGNMVPHKKWTIWHSVLYKNFASLTQARKIEVYVDGTYLITIFDGQISTICGFDQQVPNSNLALVMKNWNTTRIEADEISESEMPQSLRDIPELLKGLKEPKSVNQDGKESDLKDAK